MLDAVGGMEVLVVEGFMLLGVVMHVVFVMCRKSFIRVCLKVSLFPLLAGHPRAWCMFAFT